MEHKTFPGFVTKANEDQGTVKAVFALFGNIDQVDDIIHPGAFVKTFHERGLKVRVLDAHRTDSIMRALGKPLSLREIGRDELPNELRMQYPAVTGGAEAEIQFLMDTPEGKGAFIRLKEQAVDEWSFGFDTLDSDHSKMIKDGEEVTVRNLRGVKLYEISPVLWGCNPATATLSAKDAKPAPDVTENTIRIRVRDPGDFQEDSFRTIAIDKGKGIQATIGKLEGEDSTTVQSYVFDKEKWTPARAQAWVDDHDKDFDPNATEKVLTEEDAPELVPVEEGESFTCECVECGYTETSPTHCADLECPKCGGQMRRAERPGAGQSSRDVDDEEKDEGGEGGVGKDFDPGAEAKIGRQLSAANARTIIPGIVALLQFLEGAGFDVPGYDRQPAPMEPPEEEQSKSADPDTETVTDAPVAEEPQDANQDQRDDEKRAGPSEEAPTPDEGAGPPEGETPTQQVDPKLALIQIGQSQLDLLEV